MKNGEDKNQNRENKKLYLRPTNKTWWAKS